MALDIVVKAPAAKLDIKWFPRVHARFIRDVIHELPPAIQPVPRAVFAHEWSEARLGYLLKAWKLTKQKAAGKPIIMPGRDVFLFSVLSKLEGRKQDLFDPRMSTPVSTAYASRKIWRTRKFKDYFGIDTGYSGTVLSRLGVPHWALLSGKNQLSVEISGTGLCGIMECTPKYWNRASTKNVADKTRVVQPYAPHLEFKNAAALTRLVVDYALDHKELWVG